jgi:hypothetical protein
MAVGQGPNWGRSAKREKNLKLNYDYVLPDSLQSIIHYHQVITDCVVWLLIASLC